MISPRAADYLEALQFPEECFADPELASGSVEATRLGLPRAVSGNVAAVFKVTAASGRPYAVRCFVRWFDDLADRYAAIADHLRTASGTWSVGIDFQPEGVRVGDSSYPILKMAWSDATPLVPWIETHLWDTAAMSYAATRFVALVAELRSAGIAHGDLQHGNVLPAPGGDLRLVDYDGMYVPALAGLGSNELGHRNYAHPGRTREDFGPHLDAFPSWVVYVSLAALSIDPLLWGRLDGGDECLLFRAADFADPAGSEAIACLEESGDHRLVALAEALRAQLARRVDDLEPLSFATAPPPALALAGGRETVSLDDLRERQSLLQVLRTASTPVVEDEPTVEQPAPPSSWTGPAPDVRVAAAFGPELGRHRRSLAAVLGVLAVVPFLGAVGVLSVAASVAVSVAGVAVAVWLMAQQFHSLPAVQAARPQQQAVAERRRAVDDTAARVEELSADRAAIDADEQRIAADYTRAEAELRHREQVELQGIDNARRDTLSDLDTREHELYRAEHHERADALRALQVQVLDGELARHRLATVKMPGITDKLVYGMALDDVRTAADFIDVLVEDEVVLVRADGRRVRTSSLGPSEAQALLRWRRMLESQYEYLLPQHLPSERDAVVREAYAAKRAALADEGGRVREDAARRAEEVRAAVRTERERRADALHEAKQHAAERRVQVDQEMGRARKALAEAQFRLVAAERAAGTARDLTLAAYFRLLIGR